MEKRSYTQTSPPHCNHAWHFLYFTVETPQCTVWCIATSHNWWFNSYTYLFGDKRHVAVFAKENQQLVVRGSNKLVEVPSSLPAVRNELGLKILHVWRLNVYSSLRAIEYIFHLNHLGIKGLSLKISQKNNNSLLPVSPLLHIIFVEREEPGTYMGVIQHTNLCLIQTTVQYSISWSPSLSALCCSAAATYSWAFWRLSWVQKCSQSQSSSPSKAKARIGRAPRPLLEVHVGSLTTIISKLDMAKEPELIVFQEPVSRPVKIGREATREREKFLVSYFQIGSPHHPHITY